MLLMVDDFADYLKFVRYSSLLQGLFTRGRRNAISCILSMQKYNVLAPIISVKSRRFHLTLGHKALGNQS